MAFIVATYEFEAASVTKTRMGRRCWLSLVEWLPLTKASLFAGYQILSAKTCPVV